MLIGRTSTMSETVNYTVYCLLMTPDGAKCNPAGLPFISSTDPAMTGGVLTAYTNSGAITGGFRNSTISGQDMN